MTTRYWSETSEPIPFLNRIIFYECVEVEAALFGDGVAGEEAAECGRVVAEVVVNEVEFGIVMFRRPLEGLGDVAGFRYRAEGSVAVRRADVAGGAEDFADIFGNVVAVGEPRAVFLNGKRTRRRRLRRIPGNEPKSRMRRASQIKRRNLQIPAIDVAVVQRRCSRDRHFLLEAAALRVISAFDDRLRFRILKAYRTIFSIIFNRPRSRRSLNLCYIPILIVARIKHGEHRVHGVAFLCVLRVLCVNFRVLIQRVRRIIRDSGFGIRHCDGFRRPVADVVKGVRVIVIRAGAEA